jgi:hypothetical protein
LATNYPGSLDTGTEQPSPSASTEMDDAGFEHDVVHTNHSGAIIALETKVGTGSSTAAANSVLAGTGAGTSGWTTTPTVVDLTATGNVDITGTLAVDGIVTLGDEIKGGSGSAADPVFTFASDGDTGLYPHAADDLGVSAGGTQVARFASNGIRVANGSAATPAYTFINDSNTGFYITGNSGVIYWSGNNNTGGYLFNGGIRTDDGTAGTPSHSFSGDGNTGMYRLAADTIGFSCNGLERMRIGTYGILVNSDGTTNTGDPIIGGSPGSASSPSYTFNGDGNTGMYRVSSDRIGFACGGVLTQEFRSDGIHLASGDWFRSYGSAGWYNGTYGGGWYMTDSSWVRTYNSKGILTTANYAGVNASTSSTSGWNYILRSSVFTSFAYYTSSRDVKENIVDVTANDSGAWIDALQPVQFNERYLGEDEEPEAERTWREADTQVGFIAEDVLDNPVTSQFSQIKDNGDGTLSAVGWKWECVIAAAVAEIKSLRTRVADLEAA